MVRKNFFCFSSWATLYIQNAHQILLVRTEQSSRRNHTVSLKDMGAFINNVASFHLLFEPPPSFLPNLTKFYCYYYLSIFFPRFLTPPTLKRCWRHLWTVPMTNTFILQWLPPGFFAQSIQFFQILFKNSPSLVKYRVVCNDSDLGTCC